MLEREKSRITELTFLINTMIKHDLSTHLKNS